jgi:putative oxidoreductase
MFMITSLPRKDILVFLLRILFGASFAVAGILKAISLGAFIISVRSYDIVPQFLVPGFAIMVLSFEIVFGLSLILGLFTRLSSTVLSTLLILFASAAFFEILRGNNTGCGCFGTIIQEKIGTGAVIKDLVLLSLGVWLSFRREYRWSVDSIIGREAR